MANYTENDDLTNQKFNTGDIITINYTGSYKKIKLPVGKYRFECWGANGGNTDTYIGGKGGYIAGSLNLDNSTDLYIYVGGQGLVSNGVGIAGGYNGGGAARAINSSYMMASGGGASDIRFFGEHNPTPTDLLWNSVLGFRSRIAVAAGGGGAGRFGSAGANGAYGGGLNGGGLTTGAQSTGGTQIAGGSGRAGTGIFGIGSGNSNANSCGGGGGYYGGGSDAYEWGGAGGSSFISGMLGCNAIDMNGKHTGQSIHYSELIFTDTETLSGQRIGNGKIVITVLEKEYYYLISDSLDIENITLDKFIANGLHKQELISNKIESIIFASKAINIKIKKLPQNQIIYNSDFIDISDTSYISYIEIVNQIPINSDLKFLINNKHGWFTYKNSQWYQLSTLIFEDSILSKLIVSSGMTALEISSIQTEAWTQLFPNKEKFISFMVLMTSEEFDTTPIISNILIHYDSQIYKKIKINDTLYSVKKRVNEHQITWNTTNKRKIEIIIKNKNDQ